jgi:phosphoribosylformimino-5-aminoimidazole carboxamide ribotide isomerase
MIIYPAIDLRKGRCVRLRHGDPGQETVFSDDPAEVARRWAGAGATWLHVVNLDGALESRLGAPDSAHLEALRRVLNAVETGVQFGGGIRTLDDMELLLEMGVDRLVLGTTAVRRPQLVERALADFGAEQIVVGIDARDGRVATHGWTKMSELSPLELGRQMAGMGVKRVLYTDIRRDGTLEGVNVEATADLARQTGLLVIASGGVATLDDVQALCARQADGIEGAIIGQALYTGAIDLAEAIRLFQGTQDAKC